MYVKQRGYNWWTLYSREGKTLADIYDARVIQALELPIVEAIEPEPPRLVLVQAS